MQSRMAEHAADEIGVRIFMATASAAQVNEIDSPNAAIVITSRSVVIKCVIPVEIKHNEDPIFSKSHHRLRTREAKCENGYVIGHHGWKNAVAENMARQRFVAHTMPVRLLNLTPRQFAKLVQGIGEGGLFIGIAPRKAIVPTEMLKIENRVEMVR